METLRGMSRAGLSINSGVRQTFPALHRLYDAVGREPDGASMKQSRSREGRPSPRSTSQPSCTVQQDAQPTSAQINNLHKLLGPEVQCSSWLSHGSGRSDEMHITHSLRVSHGNTTSFALSGGDYRMH